ncbi:PAS domain S-box protein [Halosimplex amylolyticum]|uniref:PAS domain S-box protein n=1 Tax=Halosimplex amylolyticum TaxID=3396616 RepID=UPI003F54C2DB
MTSSSLTEVLRETLTHFDNGAPQTTSEVADQLGIGRRSTYERLHRLVEHDRLETKKVGANGRVWWRSTTDTAGQTSRTTHGAADGEPRSVDDSDRMHSNRAGEIYPEKFESADETVAQSASVILDSAGCIQTWTADAKALTGWSEAEILDEPFSRLYAGGLADHGSLNQLLETARVDGHCEDERVCERPSGTVFSASTTITPLRTDDGVSGYTMVLRDETDRRHVEAERRLLAEVSRTVARAESFTDGIESALAAVCDHTEWAYGEAWAPVDDGKYLEYIVGHAEDQAMEPFTNASESVTFPFGEGLPGRVYASGTSEWIPDVSATTEDVFQRTDHSSDVGLQAAFGVPITTDDRVVAVLTFFLRDHRSTDDRLATVVEDVAADLGGLVARKQTEAALAESERKFRAVFEEAFDGMLIADDDAEYVDVNQAAADLFGLSEEELRGRSIAEFAPEDYDFEDAWQEFQESDHDRGLFPLVRADGERRTVEFAATPNIIPGRHLSVLRDVTEREELVRDLQLTTDRLDAIIEASPDGIIVVDTDGMVERWNPAAERIFGWTESEVLGEFPPVVPDEKRSVFKERLDAANEGETFTGLEVQRRTKAGDLIDLRLSTAPIHDASGAIAGTVVVLHDITERKTRERQLRTFRKAVEAAGHSVYYTDTDGMIEYVNPAFEETTGYTAEEAIGQTPRLLKSGEHDQDFYEELWNTILAGDTWSGELINSTKDGDRYIIEQTIAPVEDESGELEQFVAVNMDITDRKDRERRYDAIFNQTYQFTGLMDPDGTLLEANEAALEFGGMDREEVVSEKFWTADWFQHGETAQHVREAVERARNGEFVRQELEVQGADRTAIIDFSIRPVTDDHGEITYLIPEGRDITDRVEAERELQRNRDYLAALNHINDIVHDVTGAVIEQSNREEIERTVCEALVDVDSYDFAWIGDADKNQQAVTVRTEAGVQETLDEMKIPVDSGDDHGTGPTESAYRTGTIHVKNGIDTESRHDLWRDQIEARGNRSVAGIPLVHDDTVYAVLTVYTDRPNAFGEHEQAVLAQLGEIVGQAIAASERKQALMSDEIVELEFHVSDVFESMGVDASDDGRIAFDDVVATSDGAYLVYGSMTPDAHETLAAMTDQHPHWDSITVINETTDSMRFQARVTELPFRSEVASAGGSIEEVLFENGDLDLRIHLSPGADLDAITEMVEGRYPTAQTVAKRQLPRSQDSVIEVGQSLSKNLTDRQQAALEAAYHRGYFEWPRDATGEEVADSLGIAPPTFSQHLRRAEKAVFETVFSSATPA